MGPKKKNSPVGHSYDEILDNQEDDDISPSDLDGIEEESLDDYEPEDFEED